MSWPIGLSAVPAAALVCLVAVLLVGAAHTIAWLARRSARARGAEPDTSLLAFAVGLCLLALLAPVLRLSQATSVGEVLLLLGVAAAVMAAAVPLIPTPGRRAAVDARRAGTGSTRPAPAARAPQVVRRGQPVRPPTPLSRPVEPLTGVIVAPAERPHPRPPLERAPRGRVDAAATAAQAPAPAATPVEAPPTERLAADATTDSPSTDARDRLTMDVLPTPVAETLAAQRLAAERLAAGLTDRAPAAARSAIAAHDAPTAPIPRIRPADEATQALVELDRVVDGVSDALRLGPRDAT